MPDYGIVPNYVGQLQLAAPFILAAIGVAVLLLVIEHFGIPKRRR
jgi:hypothetical protein